jgi:hypothetical protein
VTSGNLCIKGRFGFQFVQNDRGGLPPPLEPAAAPPSPEEARELGSGAGQNGHSGNGHPAGD